MSIDNFAATLAHELCNAECFAFTGAETKEHSGRCQSAAKIIEAALASFKLPCDVSLPPATTIRKGCTLATLFVALSVRER